MSSATPKSTLPGRRPGDLAHLSDAQLEAHIANLDAWLALELEEARGAVAERDRRGRGGYVLTAAAEA
jgi:hypothetical protein